MSGSIKFCRGTERSWEYLAFGDSLSKVVEFANHIKKFTTADIRRCTQTNGLKMTIEGSSGDFQSLAHFAHVFFKRTRDKKLYAFKIPAPIIDIFEAQPEGDLIVTPGRGGTELAQYFTRLAGEEFTFDSGAFTGSNVD